MGNCKPNRAVTGDPLVTYEAAPHGLPIVASPMGAGRFGEETGCVIGIDSAEPETIVAALRRLTSDDEEMRIWSDRNRASVAAYSWTEVGRRRAELLTAHLHF